MKLRDLFFASLAALAVATLPATAAHALLVKVSVNFGPTITGPDNGTRTAVWELPEEIAAKGRRGSLEADSDDVWLVKPKSRTRREPMSLPEQVCCRLAECGPAGPSIPSVVSKRNMPRRSEAKPR